MTNGLYAKLSIYDIFISNEMWFRHYSYASSKRTLHNTKQSVREGWFYNAWVLRLTSSYSFYFLVNIYVLLRNRIWLSYVMYRITKETLFYLFARHVTNTKHLFKHDQINNMLPRKGISSPQMVGSNLNMVISAETQIYNMLKNLYEDLIMSPMNWIIGMSEIYYFGCICLYLKMVFTLYFLNSTLCKYVLHTLG